MDKEEICNTHTYTMEYYSVIEKNNISPSAATWMDLEAIMLSETLLCQQRSVWSRLWFFQWSCKWMWKLDCEESWAPKNWCFWTVVLEKTLKSPLDFKEIQPVDPEGDKSWVFIGRIDAEAETPILWPPHAKSWLVEKDPDAGRDWGQEEKGMTEDEMVGWHHWLDGHEFE